MTWRAVFWMSIVGMAISSAGAGYGFGIVKGRWIEQEETRHFVNSRMTQAGFCSWFEQSRIAEDCAALREDAARKAGQ